MIKQLFKKDLKSVMTLLEQDKSYNIFIIGDIEAFGFETDFQTVYGEYLDHQLVSILLFYHENVCYYSLDEAINPAYFTLLDDHGFESISGHPKLLEPFAQHYPLLERKTMYFCENTRPARAMPNRVIKKATTKEDFEKIYYCLKTIEEFDVKTQSLDMFTKRKMNWANKQTCLYIEEDNKAVATATATCETAYNAMVVGVATLESKRHLGLASDLINALTIEYVQNKHKSLCLFYDNPSAGSIYHRLGYQTIGQWLMLK
jgi:predicted GNAT family acetyltransferase